MNNTQTTLMLPNNEKEWLLDIFNYCGGKKVYSSYWAFIKKIISNSVDYKEMVEEARKKEQFELWKLNNNGGTEMSEEDTPVEAVEEEKEAEEPTEEVKEE